MLTIFRKGFTMWLRLTPNSRFSCLCLSSVGTTGICYYTLGVPHHSQCVCSKQSEENQSWVEEPPIVFNKNRARKFDGYSIKLIVLPLVRKSSEKYFINISIHYFIWQLLGMRYKASIVPGTWLIDGNKTDKILIFLELRFQRLEKRQV